MSIRTEVGAHGRRQSAVAVPLLFTLALLVCLAIPAHGRAGTYFDPPAVYNVPLPSVARIGAMVAGEFNGDGAPDLAFTGLYPSNVYAGFFALNINDQTGDFSTAPTPRQISYIGTPVAVGVDIDGDGRTGLAFANTQNGRIFYYYDNDRDVGIGTAGGNVPAIYMIEAIAGADMDNDDDADLAVVDRYGRLFLVINQYGRYNQTARAVDLAQPVVCNSDAWVTADFNQDGRVDLAAADSATANIAVLINQIAAVDPTTAQFGEINTKLADVAPNRLVVGDFDGQNGPDLAFSDANSNALYVMFNDGGGFFADPVGPVTCGGRPGPLAAGDVDQDGRPELIAALADMNRIELFSYQVHEGRFSLTAAVDTGLVDPVALIATDLNMDEKIDLAAANAGDNTVSVLINRYEPVVDLSELVEIGTVSTGKPYGLTSVDNTRIYIDRPYSIIEKSAGLEGGLLLQTANNDKWVRSDHHLQLWVHGEAVLLVCYDSRARRLPSWLQEGGWTQTMESIRSTDHRAGAMQVFMKEVSGTKQDPTELWLGGNHAGGDTRARSNYYLVVQSKAVPLTLPPVEIVEVSTRKPYKTTLLQKGGRIYIDRGYRLVDSSDAFDGAVLVQTANNDKWVRDSSHLILRMKRDAAVFACYDRRARRLPAWLEDGSWKPANLKFYSTDRRAGPMTVWMRPVVAGEMLHLGGNHEGGYTWARSNYLIVVQTEPVEVDVPEMPVVQVSGRRNFQLETAEPGNRVYLDRSYRILEVSDGLLGGILVMTANNDKWYRGGSYMTLQFGQAAAVYVCYDKRNRFLPRWLAEGGWDVSGESILTRDRSAGPMPVYTRSVSAGEALTLGGNHQGGYNRARSNYFVVVKPLP